MNINKGGMMGIMILLIGMVLLAVALLIVTRNYYNERVRASKFKSAAIREQHELRAELESQRLKMRKLEQSREQLAGS